MAGNRIEDALIEKVRGLTPEQQQEVLDFAVRLAAEGVRPRKSMYGIWAGEFPSVTEEELAAARREMWGGFPRDTGCTMEALVR